MPRPQSFYTAHWTTLRCHVSNHGHTFFLRKRGYGKTRPISSTPGQCYVIAAFHLSISDSVFFWATKVLSVRIRPNSQLLRSSLVDSPGKFKYSYPSCAFITWSCIAHSTLYIYFIHLNFDFINWSYATDLIVDHPPTWRWLMRYRRWPRPRLLYSEVHNGWISWWTIWRYRRFPRYSRYVYYSDVNH
jgi:hypothetical protein